MSDGILLQIRDDGRAELYDDTYDITIHCSSQEEQDAARVLLKRAGAIPHWVSQDDIPRWIPCSERLPEFPCLVSDANNNFPYVPAGIIKLEDKEHGKWAIDGKWFERMMLDGKEADMLIYSNRIVAWMPLPEPYKEGGADG